MFQGFSGLYKIFVEIWFKTESISCEHKHFLNPELRLKPSYVNTKFPDLIPRLSCKWCSMNSHHLHQIFVYNREPSTWRHGVVKCCIVTRNRCLTYPSPFKCPLQHLSNTALPEGVARLCLCATWLMSGCHTSVPVFWGLFNIVSNNVWVKVSLNVFVGKWLVGIVDEGAAETGFIAW